MNDLSHSYSTVLRLRGVRQLVISTTLGRTANQMTSLVLILLALRLYHSPVLAGSVVLVQLVAVPVGPLAGALVDRLGSSIMIAIDFAVAGLVMACLAALYLAQLLPVGIFLILILVGTVTWPFSGAGVKALLPRLVPASLWDRANALDSVTSVVAMIAGPVAAGTIFGLAGPLAALVAVACLYMLSAALVLGIPGQPSRTTAPILSQALGGLRYFLANRQLRGLALAMVFSNASYGVLMVAIPVLVLRSLHSGSQLVGWICAVLGACSLGSALLFGRLGTKGRERRLLALSFGAPVPLVLIAAALPSVAMTFVLAAGLGLCLGPGDVALYSFRQRAVDPAWYGRAIAVSMTLNSSGGALGGGLGGVLAQASPQAAIAIAALISLIGAGLALLIPHARASGSAPPPAAKEAPARTATP
jgi:MFS family permease